MEDLALLLNRLQSGELEKKLAKSIKPPLKAFDVPKLLIRVGLEAKIAMKLMPFFLHSELVGDPQDLISLGNITLRQLVKRLSNACLTLLREGHQETDLADLLKHGGNPGMLATKPALLLNFNELDLKTLLKGAKIHKIRITAAITRGYAETLKDLATALGCSVDEATLHEFVDSASYTALNKLVFSAHVSQKFDKLDSGLLFQPSNYDDFVTALKDWKTQSTEAKLARLRASPESSPPVRRDSLGYRIEETLKTYEGLRILQIAKGENTHGIDSIISACKLQLSRYRQEEAQQLKSDKWQDNYRQGLSDIFQFYAKQVRMIGRNPSFAEIEEANKVWNLSKFLKFLKDFGLAEVSGTSRSITRIEGTDIFMKHAHLRKSLTEAAFVHSLETVAEMYFNAEYDAQNGTKIARQSQEDKLNKLCELLECDNSAKYNKKMKGFGLPFSSDTRCRIPSDDPAKRYKFKATPQIIEELNDWKRRSPRRANLSSLTPKVRHSPDRDLIDSKFSHTKRPSVQTEAKTVITWKKLGDMSFEQLKDPSDEFDLRDLIVDFETNDTFTPKLPSLNDKPRLARPSLKARSSESSSWQIENSYFLKSKHKFKT